MNVVIILDDPAGNSYIQVNSYIISSLQSWVQRNKLEALSEVTVPPITFVWRSNEVTFFVFAEFIRA